MHCKVVLIGLLAAFLIPQTARATLVPAISISKLTQEASLIVVGEITSVQEDENREFEIGGQLRKARRMHAVLRVDRVIKGKAESEVAFSFLIPEDFLGYTIVQRDQFGMFFFHENLDGLVLVFAIPSRDSRCARELRDRGRGSRKSCRGDRVHSEISRCRSPRSADSSPILSHCAGECIDDPSQSY